MSRFSPLSRAEKWIAIGRVALAGFCLLASNLDRSEPAGHARVISTLLGVYLGYAFIVLGSLGILQKLPQALLVATQVFDLAAFLAFIYFTGGPGSPFFVCLTFSLVCATLRWHWRGTLWTAVVSTSILLGMGIYANRVQRDPGFHWNGFIVQSSQLLIVAGLLCYLGAYQERLSSERSRLAQWPQREPKEIWTLVRDLLEYASTILESPRMLMVWEDPKEPWTHVACLSDEFEFSDEPLAAFGSLVVKPLAGKSFFCRDAASDKPWVFIHSPDRQETLRGAPVDPKLQARFQMRSVLSWSLAGDAIAGRLFALDKPEITLDDLILGEIVASLAVVRVDQFAVRRRLRETAATEERIRLSRDLHDGVLQSLTGVALQLQVSRRLLDRDPETAKNRLREIQVSIAGEQQELRAFIDRLRPAPTGAEPSRGESLSIRLEAACNRIERLWGLRVKLSSQFLTWDLPESLSEDVLRIINEALVNAARHAEASVLQVDVQRGDTALLITVIDNGRGFSFLGTYDLATLREMKAGPITLKDRISALGGNLVIRSSESGARLDISLPLARVEA